MHEHQVVLNTINELLCNLKTNPDEWQNTSLSDYLESLNAWLEAWQKKHNEPLSWELVAKMFQAAKYYE